MRFHKKAKPPIRLLISILLFALCAAGCWTEISSISHQAAQAEQENLLSALERSAVHCYAVEGTYPESLDILKDHYGITWDETKYVVDYEIIGSNLKPSITVIPLKEVRK